MEVTERPHKPVQWRKGMYSGWLEDRKESLVKRKVSIDGHVKSTSPGKRRRGIELHRCDSRRVRKRPLKGQAVAWDDRTL
ncbi:hypothetical protein JCM31598_01100 [Desulfonatronum parangueonense]